VLPEVGMELRCNTFPVVKKGEGDVGQVQFLRLEGAGSQKELWCPQKCMRTRTARTLAIRPRRWRRMPASSPRNDGRPSLFHRDNPADLSRDAQPVEQYVTAHDHVNAASPVRPPLRANCQRRDRRPLRPLPGHRPGRWGRATPTAPTRMPVREVAQESPSKSEDAR